MEYTDNISSLAMANISLALIANIFLAGITIFLLKRNQNPNGFSFYGLLLFNVIVFILSIVLLRLDISIGTGIGLFAVLSMLRFRSKVLQFKEMISLLLLITIGIVHASSPAALSIGELLLFDALILFITIAICTRSSKAYPINITLNNKDLVKVNNKVEFKQSLENKLGCRVKSYSIVNINLNRNKVEVIAMVDENCPKKPSFTSSKKSFHKLFEISQSVDNKALRVNNL